MRFSAFSAPRTACPRYMIPLCAHKTACCVLCGGRVRGSYRPLQVELLRPIRTTPGTALAAYRYPRHRRSTCGARRRSCHPAASSPTRPGLHLFIHSEVRAWQGARPGSEMNRAERSRQRPDPPKPVILPLSRDHSGPEGPRWVDRTAGDWDTGHV